MAPPRAMPAMSKSTFLSLPPSLSRFLSLSLSRSLSRAGRKAVAGAEQGKRGLRLHSSHRDLGVRGVPRGVSLDGAAEGNAGNVGEEVPRRRGAHRRQPNSYKSIRVVNFIAPKL